MTETPAGVLAIFNNVTPGRETEFETWFQHEHLAERIAIPGFLLGRRYEAVAGDRRYFNFYLTRSADVLKSAGYLERVNTPTPLTRTIMSEVFRDMIRTVCHRTFVRGETRGAAAVILRFDQRPDDAALNVCVETLVRDPAVARGEVWTAADLHELPASAEERLRGGDGRVAACLVIETLRLADAENIARALGQEFASAAMGVYRLLCEVAPR